MSVSAESGQDDLLLAGLSACHRLTDRGRDRVRRLWSGNDALGLGEVDRGGKALHLRDSNRLGETELVDVADKR